MAIGRRRALAFAVGLALLPICATTVAGAPATQPRNPTIEVAVEGLAADPPVYNDPKAPLALTAPQVDAVLAAVAAARTPIFIAIMSGKAGKAKEAARRLRAGLGHPGTYVAVSGEAYEAVSDTVDVDGLMQKAFAAERTRGTAAVLVRFVDLAGARASGSTPDPPPPTPWLQLALLALGFAILVGVYVLVTRRRGATDDGSP